MRVFSTPLRSSSAVTARIVLSVALWMSLGAWQTPNRQARTRAECTQAPCTIVSSVIAPVVPFERAFTLGRVITLEQTPEAPIRNPMFTADPAGGFLMAEGRALGSFRRYGADGKLLWSVPIESLHDGLRNPEVTARLSPTVVLLGGSPATGMSMVVQWDEQRKSVLAFQSAADIRGSMTALHSLSDASLLITAGIGSASDRALIALDPPRGRPPRSFFSPPVTPLTRAAVTLDAGRVYSDAHGDTTAAVFAFSDTIYIISKESVILEKIRLPTAYFVAPKRASRPDLADLGAWTRSVGEAAGIFWLPDGRFLIEYQHAIDSNSRRERCFLLVARNGDGLLDVHDWDSHVQMMDARGTFYFVDPKTDDRSRLLVATLKSGG
jgi:hypothetical protein